MKRILITNSVNDTYTNASGFQLYSLMKQSIKANEVLEISFKGSGAPSSSFLNSSIGEIISEYGLESFKKYYRLTEITKGHIKVLRHYFNQLEAAL